jgi:hypothetical protein
MRREARTAVHSLRRAALVALFALATFAVLPFVHVLSSGCGASPASCSSERPAPIHSAECGVCGSLAHASARALDVPAAIAAIAVPLGRASAPHAPARVAPAPEIDAPTARGPPVLPSHA